MITIKNSILFINMCLEKLKIYVLNLKIIRIYLNIYNKYWKQLVFVELCIIVILSFYIDKLLFFDKLFSVIIVTLIILFWKYIYIIILKYFDWNGRFPIYGNKKIKNYFIKNNLLNRFFIFYLKYFNLYRLILIIRNKITILLRYIRYFFIKYTKLFKYWLLFEKIMTIIANFLFDYIYMLIDEIYLKFKINIISSNLNYIIIGRIQVFFFICLTKGLISFILVLLIFKLIKLINARLLHWANNVNVYMYTYSSSFYIGIFSKGDLNWRLFENSYILRNLNFDKNERYLGYNKVVPVFSIDSDMMDTLYVNFYKFRYYDIYKGIYMNEICELNYIIRNLFKYRLWIEYCLSNEELKEYWIALNKLNDILKESFIIIKNILFILKKNNIMFKLIVTFISYEPILVIDLLLENYLDNFDSYNTCLTFYEENKKLKDLHYNKYLKVYFNKEDVNYSLCTITAKEYFLNKYEINATACLEEIRDVYINKIFLIELLDENNINK